MRFPENEKQPAEQPRDGVQPLTEEELSKVAGGFGSVLCPLCNKTYDPDWPGAPCPYCCPPERYERF